MHKIFARILAFAVIALGFAPYFFVVHAQKESQPQVNSTFQSIVQDAAAFLESSIKTNQFYLLTATRGSVQAMEQAAEATTNQASAVAEEGGTFLHFVGQGLIEFFKALVSVPAGIVEAIGQTTSSLLAGTKSTGEKRVLGEQTSAPTPTTKPVETVQAAPRQDTLVEGVIADVADLREQVQLLQIGQAPTVPALTSLDATLVNSIRNSSFESNNSGKPNQWNYQLDSGSGNTAVSTEDYKSGAQSLKFKGEGQGRFGISQPTVKLLKGRSYTFSAYLKVINAPSFSFRLGYWDEVNNKRADLKDWSYSGTKEWHRISFTINNQGTEDGKKWYPLIEIFDLKSGSVYLDNIQLEEGTVATIYHCNGGCTSNHFGSTIGDGSVLIHPDGSIYPALSGKGKLGTTDNKWKELRLSSASIDENGSLSLDGSATVDDELTVGGLGTFKNNLQVNGAATVSGTLKASGAVTFENNLTVSGTLTAGTITGSSGSGIATNLTDNIADALDIQEGTNNYININTTNGSEALTLGNVVSNPTLTLQTSKNAANAIELISAAGGIDISTGSDGAGNDIDILGGASVRVTAAESAADSIVLSSAAGGIDILATGATAGEDIDITATGSSVNIAGTEGAVDAITIVAAAGGIDISTGSGTADIDILGGDVINITSRANATANAIVISAVTGGIDISTGSGSAGNDIDILSGASVTIRGAESDANAIVLDANDGAAGGVNIDVGTSGLDVDGTGSMSLNSSQGATNAIELIATAGGIDISTGGNTADIDILGGDVINITSQANATANAIVISAPVGGIDISTGSDGAGNDIDILGGASVRVTAAESAADSIVLSSAAGGIDILATGATAGEDIDITATGSSVNIAGTEGAVDAITIVAAAGGIDISTGSATSNIDIAGGQDINIGVAATRDVIVLSDDWSVTAAGIVSVSQSSTAFTERLCSNASTGNTALVNNQIGDCNGVGQADFAEYYGTDGTVEAADLVVASGDAHESVVDGVGVSSRAWVAKTSKPYDQLILGVASTNPYVEILGWGTFKDSEHPKAIALSGRVPIKVTGENGSIRPGDYLTSSSTSGYAMRATKAGVVVGMALSSFSGDKGKAIVLIAPGYWSPADVEKKDVLAALGTTGDVLGAQTIDALPNSAEIQSPIPTITSSADTNDVQQTVGGTSQVLGVSQQASQVLSGQNISTAELVVTKVAEFKGTLTVSGLATFTGDITIAGDTKIGGNLTVKGAILQEFTAGETLKAGEAVYISGKNLVKKAGSLEESKMPAIGVVVKDVDEGTSAQVAVAGTVGNFTNLEIGKRYFSGENGALTTGIPEKAKRAVQMGVARSEAEMLIQIYELSYTEVVQNSLPSTAQVARSSPDTSTYPSPLPTTPEQPETKPITVEVTTSSATQQTPAEVIVEITTSPTPTPENNPTQ